MFAWLYSSPNRSSMRKMCAGASVRMVLSKKRRKSEVPEPFGPVRQDHGCTEGIRVFLTAEVAVLAQAYLHELVFFLFGLR